MGQTCHSQAFLKGLLPFQRQEITLPLRDEEKKGSGCGGGGVFLLLQIKHPVTQMSIVHTRWLSVPHLTAATVSSH